MTIMGSITSTNESEFDGNINLVEQFSINYIGSADLKPFYYSSEIELIIPNTTDFNIEMPRIIPAGANILGFSESIETEMTISE